MDRPNSLRGALASGCALAALMFAAAAAAQPAITVNIPAQSAAGALQELSRQAGVNILFAPASVRGLTAPDIQGATTPDKAARMIVAEGRLDVVREPSGSLVVRERPALVKTASPAPPPSGRVRAIVQPSAPVDEPAGLEEVIVTAQRRSQNLQTVPVSVTAVSAQDLASLGVRSTADIAQIAPSVTFSTGPAAGSVTVRGVGGTGAGGDEPANAVYLDGVYLPSPSATVFQFNNIERIEVLKGPQGTLFGRNASGGLVQVITRAPSFDTAANAEIGYGTYETTRATGYFSTGLTDTLAFNVAGLVEDQGEGWGRNLATGNDAYRGYFSGLHAKLLWQPTDRTSVTGAVLVSRVKPTGSQGASILPGTLSISGRGNQGFFNVDTDVDTYSRTSSTNYSLTVRHDLGWANLTSITSRDVLTSSLIGDQDGSRVPLLVIGIGGDNKSWTQEFQLSSNETSRITWVLGAFYYHNDSRGVVTTRGLAVAPLLVSGSRTRQVTDSYAVYGQATAPVADGTNLTLGLRYTQDDRDLTGFAFTNLVARVPIVPQTKEDQKVTWRLAIDHKFGENILGYASYSRGFKSGLFNAAAPSLPPVEPQTADSIEVGVKSELFERRLRLNVAAFDNKIDAIQVRGLFPGVATPIFYNASGAHIYGAEADFNIFVSPRLSFQGGLSYLHGRYESGFTNALAFAPRSGPPFGALQFTADASDNETTYTPEWAGSFGGRYTIPTSFGSVVLSGNYTYNSGYFFDPQNRVSNPEVNILNATVEVNLRDHLKVRVWGNNLSDERYFSVINSAAFGDTYLPQAPLTYGVSVGWTF